MLVSNPDWVGWCVGGGVGGEGGGHILPVNHRCANATLLHDGETQAGRREGAELGGGKERTFLWRNRSLRLRIGTDRSLIYCRSSSYLRTSGATRGPHERRTFILN